MVYCATWCLFTWPAGDSRGRWEGGFCWRESGALFSAGCSSWLVLKDQSAPPVRLNQLQSEEDAPFSPLITSFSSATGSQILELPAPLGRNGGGWCGEGSRTPLPPLSSQLRTQRTRSWRTRSPTSCLSRKRKKQKQGECPLRRIYWEKFRSKFMFLTSKLLRHTLVLIWWQFGSIFLRFKKNKMFVYRSSTANTSKYWSKVIKHLSVQWLCSLKALCPGIYFVILRNVSLAASQLDSARFVAVPTNHFTKLLSDSWRVYLVL